MMIHQVLPTAFAIHNCLADCQQNSVLPAFPCVVAKMSGIWVRWFPYLLNDHSFPFQPSMVINSLVTFGKHLLQFLKQ